jgi:hypothetical protein
MNCIKLKEVTIKVSAAFIVLFAIMMLPSCGTTNFDFSKSTVVPAAEGSVKVKKDKNNNYNIDLHVKRLADPKRLSPEKKMYVVWLKTEDKGSINIGQLKSSSLKTVTTFKPTDFFITAEDNADIRYPEGQTVLNTGN